jgi:hypothetical protein
VGESGGVISFSFGGRKGRGRSGERRIVVEGRAEDYTSQSIYSHIQSVFPDLDYCHSQSWKRPSWYRRTASPLIDTRNFSFRNPSSRLVKLYRGTIGAPDLERQTRGMDAVFLCQNSNKSTSRRQTLPSQQLILVPLRVR